MSHEDWKYLVKKCADQSQELGVLKSNLYYLKWRLNRIVELVDEHQSDPPVVVYGNTHDTLVAIKENAEAGIAVLLKQRGEKG